MNAIDAAKYVLSHPIIQQDEMTHLKLQKLVYYLKVWSVVDNHPDLITGDFVKWKLGPVNVNIWEKYKSFGKKPIPHETCPDNYLSTYEKDFVDFILENYAPINAYSLSAMTHSEDPWKKTPDNQVIKENAMKQYYSGTLFARNFPLDLNNKPFYPLYYDSHAAFYLDIPKKDQEKFLVFDNYIHYKKLKNSNKMNSSHLDAFFKS